jgi:hypothetical protein
LLPEPDPLALDGIKQPPRVEGQEMLRSRAFVLVGAHCGLRLGEMAGLRRTPSTCSIATPGSSRRPAESRACQLRSIAWSSLLSSTAPSS